jgi:hypothetical protein
MSVQPPDDPFSSQPLVALVLIGHDLDARARRLHAEYLCMHILAGKGLLVFTCERQAMWVTGAGFDVELTALPEWERWRPPGY